MASEPEHSSAVIAKPSRWRPLNLQLMRVMLRVYSTAEYDEAEGRLQQMIYERLSRLVFPDLGRITEEDRAELLLRFVCRWRAGQLTGFSRCYVRWVLVDLRRREARAGRKLVEEGQEHIDAAPDRRGLSPDKIVLLEEIEGRFQKSLTQEDERALFNAWIENGDRQGWQREFARQWGKSDRWVSVTLKRFRMRLETEHGIRDTDAFVDVLGSLRDAEDDLPSIPVLAEEESVEEPSGEQALVLRDRLRKSFVEGSRERKLFECYSAGCPWEEIQREFPDEENLLLNLHQRYICLGRELVSKPNHAQEAKGHARE
jgi:hypothetical protein